MSSKAPELEIERLEEAVSKHFGASGPEFVYAEEGGVVTLTLTTTSPRHQQRFLFHRTSGASKQQSLKAMLAYIRDHRSSEPTYTIQWRAFDESELHTSYFSASNILGALDKFFFERDLHTITVYSVTLNPMS